MRSYKNTPSRRSVFIFFFVTYGGGATMDKTTGNCLCKQGSSTLADENLCQKLSRQSNTPRNDWKMQT